MKELGGLYISFDGNKPKSLSNISKTQKNPNNPDEVNIIIIIIYYSRWNIDYFCNFNL